jgi:hypothetical protein
MNTLALNPSYPVTMRPLAPTYKGALGSGSRALRRQWQRPYHEFSLGLPFENERLMEQVVAFAAYHMGDTPFWFDGVQFGEFRSAVPFAFGDGSTADFYLPRRNVFANSWKIYVNGALNTAWTINESSGLLTFTAAPADNAQITGLGRCRYKCVFWYDQQIFEANEIYSRLYDMGRIVLQETQ